MMEVGGVENQKQAVLFSGPLASSDSDLTYHNGLPAQPDLTYQNEEYDHMPLYAEDCHTLPENLAAFNSNYPPDYHPNTREDALEDADSEFASQHAYPLEAPIQHDPADPGFLPGEQSLLDYYDHLANKRLMGIPSVPITPDDPGVMGAPCPDESAKNVDPLEQQASDLLRHATLLQLLEDAEMLFSKWDYSRPDVLASRGIQIGVCPVKPTAEEDSAHTRRFFIFDDQGAIGAQQDYEGEYAYDWERPPEGRESGEISSPHQGALTIKYPKEVTGDCLYKVTFYLDLDPTAAPPFDTPPSSARETCIITSDDLLAMGHMVPELCAADSYKHSGSPVSGSAEPKAQDHRADDRDADPLSVAMGLLTPRQHPRYREPYKMISLLGGSSLGSEDLSEPGGPDQMGAGSNGDDRRVSSPLLAATKDPYTTPRTPRPGRGFGIVLAPGSKETGGLPVATSILPGGAAAASGLFQLGDRLADVSGTSVRGWRLERVAALMAKEAARARRDNRERPTRRVRVSVIRRGPRGHGRVCGDTPSGPIMCFPLDDWPPV